MALKLRTFAIADVPWDILYHVAWKLATTKNILPESVKTMPLEDVVGFLKVLLLHK